MIEVIFFLGVANTPAKSVSTATVFASTLVKCPLNRSPLVNFSNTLLPLSADGFFSGAVRGASSIESTAEKRKDSGLAADSFSHWRKRLPVSSINCPLICEPSKRWRWSDESMFSEMSSALLDTLLGFHEIFGASTNLIRSPFLSIKTWAFA